MQHVQIIIHPPGGALADLQLSASVTHSLTDWLDLARAEAQSLQPNFIGPEHIALACLNTGLIVMNGEHRVTHAAYRAHLLEIVGMGTPGPAGFPVRPGPLLSRLLAHLPDLPLNSAALLRTALFRTALLAYDGLARRLVIRSQR